MKFLLLSFLVFSSSAFAVESTQTLVPHASQVELELGADYLFGNQTTNTTPNVNNSVTGSDIPFSAYYGVNDNNAFGVSTTYTSKKITTSLAGFATSYPAVKYEGLDAVTLGYKGNFDMEMFTLFVSAGIAIPTEKATADDTSYKFTNTAGQIQVPVHVGYVSHVPQARLGAIAGYTFANPGSADIKGVYPYTVSVDTKGGGGYDLTAFIELPNALNLNVALAYAKYYTVRIEGSGLSGIFNPGHEELGLKASLRIHIADNFEVIPSGSYMPWLHQSDYGYSKYDQFSVGALARFLF
jgi:hypothetical protein